jgi:hypothetical protein
MSAAKPSVYQSWQNRLYSCPRVVFPVDGEVFPVDGREVVMSDNEMITLVEAFAPGKYSRLKK